MKWELKKLKRVKSMKRKITRHVLTAWLMSLAFNVCAAINAFSADKELKQIYVVNYPLKYFAERIDGDKIAVKFPAPLDEDPAFWMPDAKTIRAYQQADLIILNGVGYEKWVSKVSLPESKKVDTSKGFNFR